MSVAKRSDIEADLWPWKGAVRPGDPTPWKPSPTYDGFFVYDNEDETFNILATSASGYIFADRINSAVPLPARGLHDG